MPEHIDPKFKDPSMRLINIAEVKLHKMSYVRRIDGPKPLTHEHIIEYVDDKGDRFARVDNHGRLLGS